jgi:hypothetical protein
MPKTSRENAPHYRWGQGCGGWRLVDCGVGEVCDLGGTCVLDLTSP